MSTRQSIYSREYLKEDHRMHPVLSCCFFMDSRLLVVIGKLLLYPGSVDSIYLILGVPEGVKGDGEDGINFLKCISLK